VRATPYAGLHAVAPPMYDSRRSSAPCAPVGAKRSSVLACAPPHVPLAIGSDVLVGPCQLRCVDILGEGSFSKVWRVRDLATGGPDLALKDQLCRSQDELNRSILECSILSEIHRGAIPARTPQVLAHEAVPHGSGWQMKIAMTLTSGVQADEWLANAPALGHDWATSFRRSCKLTAGLLKQLGPTLELLAPLAVHRDVNSHNILLDIVEDKATDTFHANFWLIDFGLAVDAKQWASDVAPDAWRSTPPAGDTRYWAPATWFRWLHGIDALRLQPHLCRQYIQYQDSFGLGVSAVELLCNLCSQSLRSHPSHVGEAAHAWSQLLSAWDNYHDTLWGLHAKQFELFKAGKPMEPLRMEMAQAGVAKTIIALVADIRQSLHGCAQLAAEASERRLLTTLAQLLDEECVMSLHDVLAGLDSDSPPGSPTTGMKRESVANFPSVENGAVSMMFHGVPRVHRLGALR